ncbi:MAG TPA: hypothetical protein VK742_04205 [Candidatus Sulfotelmatobacter sp.]|nr:hypothetical protein [Candidatus Sulfotelmatobacter sp.]
MNKKLMKSFNLVVIFLAFCLFVNAAASLPIDKSDLSNCFIWANGWVKDGKTNCFYVPDIGKLPVHDQLSGSNKHKYCIELNPQEIETIKEMPECKPAEDFPEGNWGEVQNGFQLSLRFAKPVFNAGEPIAVTLLLRNVGDGSLMYDTLPAGYSDGPIGFEIVSSDGRNLPQHLSQLGTLSGGTTATLFPGTQVKFMERLDKRFDLTNGTYSVRAITKAGALVSGVSMENGKPVFHPVDAGDTKFVKSAEVTIRIQN